VIEVTRLRTERADAAALGALIRARHPCIRIETAEESHAREIIEAAVLSYDHRLWSWSVTRGLRKALLEQSDTVEDTEHPAGALCHLAWHVERPWICMMFDLASHLRDDRTERAFRDAMQICREHGCMMILVDHEASYPPIIMHEATPFTLSLPDETELEGLLKSTLRAMNRERPIRISLGRPALRALLRNLRGLTRDQAVQFIRDAISVDDTLDDDDAVDVLANKRRLLHQDGLLEFVDAPASLDEIGGMRALKAWLRDREHAFDDDAHDYGIVPPRGLLLLGVQGAGKSLCAKAVATAWRRPLLRLDPGMLYDRFVGASEQRLRRALHQAESMSPIVLWIDEIEKGFASAAAHSTDGGLSQRLFGTLLTWMQEHREPVFLIATANNIEALPPELLRKGRFDEIFFVDLPDATIRQRIFTIHLKKRQRNPKSFDLQRLSAATDGFSGAEIEQAIVAALHTAFASNVARDDLTTDHLIEAVEATTPLSVTMHERIRYLREWASTRCRPAE